MKEIKYEGILYLVGENAQDNWKLLTSSKQQWVWFHLDKVSSPYVILTKSIKDLKNEHLDKSWKEYIIKACILCKENSKYKNNKVKVIYTNVKNISKGNNVGEAIIKGKVNYMTI